MFGDRKGRSRPVQSPSWLTNLEPSAASEFGGPRGSEFDLPHFAGALWRLGLPGSHGMPQWQQHDLVVSAQLHQTYAAHVATGPARVVPQLVRCHDILPMGLGPVTMGPHWTTKIPW